MCLAQGVTADTEKTTRYPATRAGVALGDRGGMGMFGTPVMRSAFSGRAETSGDKRPCAKISVSDT